LSTKFSSGKSISPAKISKSDPPTRYRLPHDNLFFATLISINESASLGSGFRVKYKGFNFLVTAKHVLFTKNAVRYGDDMVLTCYGPERNETAPWIYLVDLREAKVFSSVAYDIAAVLLGSNVAIEGHDHKTPLKELKANDVRPTHLVPEPYVSVASAGSGHIVSLDAEAIGKLDNVSLANDVYLSGFPTSLGIRSNDYYDFRKPLIRKGIVAGIYPEKSTFVIDCPSYPGNSGGPVVEHCSDDYFRVTGVVSKFIPYETRWHSNRGDVTNVDIANSGYTVCTSMDAVVKMLEDAVAQLNSESDCR